MAKVKNNIITQGLSGMIGEQLVFRQTRYGTVVSVAPGEQTGSVTPAQQAQRARFQQAALYAKGRAQDPAVQAEYAPVAQERAGTVFTVLVADFLRAPDIESIDVSQYTGQVGQPIGVVVSDDFAVRAVQVRIDDADGSLVEQGAAQQQANPNEWVYRTTAANPSLAGDKITVTASDNPGNLDTESRTL